MDFLVGIFSLQFKDRPEIYVLELLEFSLRCRTEENGVDCAIKHMESKFPENAPVYEQAWFASLANAIRPYYLRPYPGESTQRVDSYKNAFTEFMRAMMTKLNGGRSLFMPNVNLNEAHFTEDELAAPHMQWVRIYVARYNELYNKFPELQAPHSRPVRIASIHPHYGVDDHLLLRLFKEFREEWTSMTYCQFVDWYCESRAHFTSEDATALLPEKEKQIRKTLSVWTENDKDVESLVDWISRNYNFHPFHRAFLTTLVEAFLREKEVSIPT